MPGTILSIQTKWTSKSAIYLLVVAKEKVFNFQSSTDIANTWRV